MNKYTDVNYKEIPKDEECYVTAVKIAEDLELPASKIRKWAEYHEDNLYIKKTKGRFSYTEKSIEQFRLIKELKFNKGMTHEQIKQYMSKRGRNLGEYDGGLINPQDPFGYDVLATKISMKNEQTLKDFLNTFITYNQEENSRMIEAIRNEVSLTTQETVENSMSSIEIKLQEQQQSNIKLTEQLEEMKKELALTKEDNKQLKNTIQNKLEEQYQQIQDNFENLDNKNKERDIVLVDNLLQKMNERKEENRKINELQEKQSLFSRIFNKKK
ncbi:TPA: MerR family transcriptional regulator [Clostridium botulinum]|nr:MerR family transcriptional regulator [Clostridium botulinum]HBJ1652863.1 MerR family transcriptional regulator [Clostridium botulinum]